MPIFKYEKRNSDLNNWRKTNTWLYQLVTGTHGTAYSPQQLTIQPILKLLSALANVFLNGWLKDAD